MGSLETCNYEILMPELCIYIPKPYSIITLILSPNTHPMLVISMGSVLVH